MSIQHLLRRLSLAFGLVLAVTQTAGAQGIPDSVSEPQFVPYVEDLQLFEQPDLSSYGNGVRPPEGWFGSAEYLNWTVGTAGKVPIGNPGTLNVWSPQARTVNTGNLTFTLVSVTVNPSPAPPSLVTNPVAGTTPSNAALVGPVPLGSTNVVPGTLTNPIQQMNGLDTGIFQSDFTSGGRFEFGRINDNRGWFVSSFNLGTQTQSTDTTNVAINFSNQPIGFVDVSGPNTVPAPGNFTNTQFLGDGYDDDLDGDGVYGRNGRDRGTQAGNGTFTAPSDHIPDPENPGSPAIAVDYDDAVRLPTLYSTLHVSNKTAVYGVEAMRLWRLDWSPRGGVWEMFAGPRFLNVNDTYGVIGTVDDLNPQYALNPLGDTAFSTNAQNHVFGGQVGTRWSRQTDRWQVGIETRFFAAANFQNVHQSGTFGSNNNTVVGGDAAALLGNTTPYRDDVINMQLPHTFSSSYNGTTFAPGGELRFNLKYQVFRKLYLTLGYTAMYVDGIARSSQMVRYTLPGLGINAQNNSQGLFMNGINFGIVINR